MNIRNSLRRKVVATIFIPIVVIYIAMIAYQSITRYSESLSQEHMLADNQASAIALKVEEQMLNDMSNCQVLSSVMQNYVSLPRKMRFERCDELARTLYDTYPHYLAVWYNWQFFTLDSKVYEHYGRVRTTLTHSEDGSIMHKVDSCDVGGENPEGLYSKIHISKTSLVSDPYFEDYVGTYEKAILEASICSPMLDPQGQFVGLCGFDVSLDSFQKMFSSLFSDNQIHAILYSADGHVVASTVDEERGKILKECPGIIDAVSLMKQTLVNDERMSDVRELAGNDVYCSVVPVRTTFDGGKWGLALLYDHNLVLSAARSDFFMSLAVGAVGLILIWLLFNRFIFNIVSPIDDITDYANNLAEGHLNYELSIDSKRRDEVGQVMRALQQMGVNMKSAISQLRDSAILLGRTANSINVDVKHLADQALHQASSMQEISTSMQEISKASNSNHGNAQAALKISGEATVKMQEGASTVKEASDTLTDIANRLAEIREIANQTTILSLNANVEAARAGEHGKGFMVVAASIRQLATRCREVSDDIEVLVGKGNKRAVAAVKSMGHVMPHIDNTANLVKQITENSYMQTSAVSQITSAIDSLNVNSQQSAAKADQMTEYANGLLQEARRLNNLVGAFEL